MDSGVTVPTGSSTGQNAGTIDYPPWKHAKLDSTLLDLAAVANPMASSIAGLMGSSVNGERGVQGVYSDGQDNAQLSPATVTLTWGDRDMAKCHSLAVWSVDRAADGKAHTGTATVLRGGGGTLLRTATVVTDPEVCGDSELVSVALHPYNFDPWQRIGVTQTDARPVSACQSGYSISRSCTSRALT